MLVVGVVGASLFIVSSCMISGTSSRRAAPAARRVALIAVMHRRRRPFLIPWFLLFCFCWFCVWFSHSLSMCLLLFVCGFHSRASQGGCPSCRVMSLCSRFMFSAFWQTLSAAQIRRTYSALDRPHRCYVMFHWTSSASASTRADGWLPKELRFRQTSVRTWQCVCVRT